MREPVARRLLRDSTAGRTALGMAAVVGVATAACIVIQAALLADILARTFMDHASLADVRGEIAWLAVTYVVRAGLLSAFELSGQLGALRVMGELRTRLARHLLVVAPGTQDRRSGALATAAVQGVDNLGGWFAKYLPQVVLSALVPPAIIVFLMTKDVTATLVLAGTVPVLITFMILIGLGAQAHARTRWRALAGLGAHFSDVVRGLPTLRAHVRDGAQQHKLDEVAEQYRVETMKTLRVAFLSAFVLELCAMIGTALVAATVGLQLVAGHLELGAGLTVLILCPELYAPLRAVGQQFHASADGLAAAERIVAVLDEPPTIAAPADDVVVAAPDPSRQPVVLDAVSHGYGERAPDVLRGASLRIAPGETVALVGPSGAGKSTLARLLLRLADPEAGVVRCGQTDLRTVDVDAWRAQIAWVPQRPALLATSIAENIRVARPGADDDAVHEAARRAGVLQFAAGLHDGLDTRVGDGGRQLSGGEAQRVALARAFLRDAPLVILDEPTAHLDSATADDVSAEIAELCAGRSALLIVHRPELAELADRIVVLRDGRLADAPVAAPATEVAA